VIAEQQSTAPELVGLNRSRLRRIDKSVQEFIDRGVIAGAVTLVGRQGQVVHVGAHGHMDVAAGREMQPDTIFRLASMTKPVVSVAILTLFEAGKLLLTDPVSAFLPAFKDLQVATGAGRVPADRQITVRDLLTHTSGLGSATTGASFEAVTALMQDRQVGSTLAACESRNDKELSMRRCRAPGRAAACRCGVARTDDRQWSIASVCGPDAVSGRRRG
jgi:CubicO group peptidase (beta-lactamase class C family)